MILSIREPKIDARKLLEMINKFSNMAEDRSIFHKSIDFYTPTINNHK